MTWACMELARHPEILKRAQAEVAEVFGHVLARQGDGKSTAAGMVPLEYDDLKQFKFLTKVINETLRLWPVVGNGIFRELMHDDICHGADGAEVKLPKGTMLQTSHWVLHRSKHLWGDDADEYRPDRWDGFSDRWGGDFAAFNPQSHRFMPFTLGKRDCLGKSEFRLALDPICTHPSPPLSLTVCPVAARANRRLCPDGDEGGALARHPQLRPPAHGALALRRN